MWLVMPVLWEEEILTHLGPQLGRQGWRLPESHGTHSPTVDPNEGYLAAGASLSHGEQVS